MTVSFCVQLCVDKCPDRHLTLVKAKLGNKEDHEYYKRYCKEGVDFAKSVNSNKETIPIINKLKLIN